MLVACGNPECSIQFSNQLRTCPGCGTVVPADVFGRKSASVIDPELIPRGKALLTTFLGMQLAIQVCILLIGISNADGQAVLTFFVRTPVTILLLVALYNGTEWVRVLWVLGIIAAMVGGIMSFAKSASPLALAFAIFHAVFLYVMVLSPSVSAFLRSQRGDDIADSTS